MSATSSTAGDVGGSAGSATPRKFAEKIYMLQKKQAEETSEFEKVMAESVVIKNQLNQLSGRPRPSYNSNHEIRTALGELSTCDVTSLSLARNELRPNVETDVKHGSLPNVSMMTAGYDRMPITIECRGSPIPASIVFDRDTARKQHSSQHHSSVCGSPSNRVNSASSPGPIRNRSRIDTSPYGTNRHSPSDTPGIYQQHLSPPDVSVRRFHSDSSLHQTVQDQSPQAGLNHLDCLNERVGDCRAAHHHRSFSPTVKRRGVTAQSNLPRQVGSSASVQHRPSFFSLRFSGDQEPVASNGSAVDMPGSGHVKMEFIDDDAQPENVVRAVPWSMGSNSKPTGSLPDLTNFSRVRSVDSGGSMVKLKRLDDLIINEEARPQGQQENSQNVSSGANRAFPSKSVACSTPMGFALCQSGQIKRDPSLTQGNVVVSSQQNGYDANGLVRLSDNEISEILALPMAMVSEAGDNASSDSIFNNDGRSASQNNKKSQLCCDSSRNNIPNVPSELKLENEPMMMNPAYVPSRKIDVSLSDYRSPQSAPVGVQSPVGMSFSTYSLGGRCASPIDIVGSQNSPVVFRPDSLNFGVLTGTPGCGSADSPFSPELLPGSGSPRQGQSDVHRDFKRLTMDPSSHKGMCNRQQFTNLSQPRELANIEGEFWYGNRGQPFQGFHRFDGPMSSPSAKTPSSIPDIILTTDEDENEDKKIFLMGLDDNPVFPDDLKSDLGLLDDNMIAG